MFAEKIVLSILGCNEIFYDQFSDLKHLQQTAQENKDTAKMAFYYYNSFTLTDRQQKAGTDLQSTILSQQFSLRSNVSLALSITLNLSIKLDSFDQPFS